MNKAVAALASLSIICATPVLALDISKMRSFRAPAGMQISASFQTVMPLLATTSLQEQSRKTEAARRALYEMASRECTVITKVFKGECQIIRVNVRSYVRNSGNGLRQITISANASYRVRRTDQHPDDRYDKKL